MDEPQIDFIEQQMIERGYLDNREMANMFNLLRSNDLIWTNVVNNYLLGGKPPAFDLLYWNSDGTRMARDAHSFYLRNTYVENNLIKPGKIEISGVPIDLAKIKGDIYAVGAENDHIVPWAAAWKITQLTGGKVRFVMASSGHIAGIINHPAGKKGGYSVREGAREVQSAETWLEGADKQPGSWWPDWVRWLTAHAGEKVPAPQAGSENYPVVCDAPELMCWKNNRLAGGGGTRRRNFSPTGSGLEVQTSSGKQPARAAATATWVRFLTPNFCMIARTWTLTVPSSTPRDRAISLLEWPASSSWKTSR